MGKYIQFPTDDAYKGDFPGIRSCSRDEFDMVLKQLISDGGARAAALGLDPSGQLLQLASSLDNLDDFQQAVILDRIVPALFSKGISSVETVGYENIDPSHGCIFISNHRDIVMDSTLLQSEMYRLFHKPSESAIGDNLTKTPWIHLMTKLCKCFTVRRGLSSPKELYEASLEMSSYIHRAVTEGNEFIWLAQREGRAKDSDDRTQPGVLKMLNLSTKSDVGEHLSSLHLTPLCLNYEYDPCDALKARELLLKKLHGTYQKQPGEDVISMKTGILGKKGRVVISVGKPLDDFISQMDSSLPMNVRIRQIAAQTDKEIHLNYHLSKNQLVAASLLQSLDDKQFTGFQPLPDDAFPSGFTPQEQASFETYMEGQLSTVSDGLTRDERHLLKLLFLLIYANPVRNHWTAKQTPAL